MGRHDHGGGHDHDHDHGHDHGHDHDHDHAPEEGRDQPPPPSTKSTKSAKSAKNDAGRGHAHGSGSDHAHDHGHDHHGELRKTPLSRLAWAFGITASFMLVEAGVGWWSKSLALVADAGHMLADAAALALAIIAQRIAMQSRTRARTYGHRRAEVLAAFANGIALGITAVWVFIEAAERWSNPPPVNATAVTITAAIGLLVNLGSAAMLASGSGGHNVNTRAALAHVLSDAVGSVGAILAGVLILVFGWTRADPVISAVIGVLVLWGGWRLIRETSRVLMEGSPVEIDIADIEGTLLRVPGVVTFHDLHVWSISEGFNVLTVHVVIGKGFHGTDVVAGVARALREEHGLDHCTIQPEPVHEEQLITLRRRPSLEAPG